MTERVLLGKRGSDHGLFVAKPGISGALTSMNRKDLIFDSTDLRTSSIHAIKEITLSSGTGSVNHNSNASSMGFIPFILWTQISGNNIIGQTGHFSFSYGGGGAQFSWGTDFVAEVSNTSTLIKRTMYTGYASGTFKVLIFNIPAE
jgi:hypothetical protein